MAGSSSTSAGRSRWPRPPRHIATSNRANRRASWYCCRDAREEASSNQPVVRDFTWNRPDESGGGHSMSKPWTRRQVLAQMGIAAAAVHTLDPHELCCATPAWAQTADKEPLEPQKVGHHAAPGRDPEAEGRCHARQQSGDEGPPRVEPPAGRGVLLGAQELQADAADANGVLDDHAPGGRT